MNNKKKIILGVIAGVIFIIAFILNLLFPPKPFVKSAHADDAALIQQYGYFVPGNQLQDSDVVVDHLPALKGWLPDDYTYGDMLLDVASSLIGSSTAINSENVDLGIQVIQTLLDSEGFWIDTTSGFIGYPIDTYDSLLDFQVHHGYSASDGPVVGNWYEVPHNYNGYFVNSSNQNVYTCIVAQGAYSYILTASYDYNASFVVGLGQYNGTISHQIGGSCNQTFNGSYVVGYFSSTTYSSSAPGSMGATAYSTRNAALSDLFGWDGTIEDPVFNGNVYLDNTLAPVNILDVPGNNGRQRSIDRNTDINNNIVNLYGGSNNVTLSPVLEDVPNNYEYELPIYPEIPHDLPAVSFEYPEIIANEDISEGLDGLSPLWVTLLTMGGSFIVLKVIL